MKTQEPDTLHLICVCHSLEHQFRWYYDESENEIEMEVHLCPPRSFWQRLRNAVRYLFGYRCRYGHFDNTTINPDDAEKMIAFLQRLKK